jgi:hypothetical protein
MKLSTDPDNDFLGGMLGSGTVLQAENGRIVLDAHEDDLVFLSQTNGSLSITISDTTVLLDDFESQNLVIRTNPACVNADDTVKVPIKGLFHRPPDHPKSTSKSAGLVFRGLYQKWLLNRPFGSKKKN